MTSHTTSILDAALQLAGDGLRIFPCRGIVPLVNKCTCYKPSCSAPGKHPHVRAWQRVATADSGQIRRWWKKWPDANPAICCGDGLLVVDVDTYKHDDTLATLEAELGPLPRNWTVRTGGRGLHVYVTLPAGVSVRSVNNWRPGIDLKSSGGYVIAPPARHQSGNLYTWESHDGDRPPLLPSMWLSVLPVDESDKPPLDEWHRAKGIQSVQRDRINQSYSVHSVLVSDRWSEDCHKFILDSVVSSTVTEADTHNKKRLNLARKLKSHDELRELDGEQLEHVYRLWFEASLPHVAENHRDWEVSFSQWLSVWDWTNIDINKEAIRVAYQKALNEPVPAIGEKYRSKAKRQLLALCRVLGTDYTGAHGEFFLSVRKGCEIIGVTKDVISQWLNDFVRDGALQKLCHRCWSTNTIQTKIVNGERRRMCTACETDLTGDRTSQRFRWIDDDPARQETAAA